MAVGWSGPDPVGFTDVGVDYELGTKYHANADITINNIRVWSPSPSTAQPSRKGRLWSAAGSQLGIATLADTLPSGWSTYALSAPVQIASGTDFWVSYSVNETYGAVTAPGYPRASGDGLVTATSGGLNVTPAAFPGGNTQVTFYGIDIDYVAGGANLRPVAGLTAQATAPLTATATVTITDESPATCSVQVEWGDGAISSGTGPQAFNHTYAAGGIYAVMVTVTDSGGLTDSAAVPLVVFGPSTVDPILDQICSFFGGPYVPAFHAYRTPTVAGVAQVRRGFDKLVDFAEFFVGQPAGTLTGCQIVVAFNDGVERRLTFPAVTGRKHNTIRVELNCFLWSTAPYVEDAQDQVHAIRRALIAKIRTDPTLGSGGFEAGGFQVGEADDRGAGGDITWAVGQPETDEDDGSSKLYLLIQFEVHELPVG